MKGWREVGGENGWNWDKGRHRECVEEGRKEGKGMREDKGMKSSIV